MSTVTIDTCVSLAAVVAVLLTLAGLILAQDRSLGAKIDGLRTELKGDIGGLRTESKADIGRLDDRVYALVAGVSPQIERARACAASGQQDR